MNDKQHDTFKELKRRMDELARSYADSHDPAVKKQLEELPVCRDEDMRTPKVFAAPDFLEARATAKWPVEQFRKSPDDDNAEGRWQNLSASLNGIKLTVNSEIRLLRERFSALHSS